MWEQDCPMWDRTMFQHIMQNVPTFNYYNNLLINHLLLFYNV